MSILMHAAPPVSEHTSPFRPRVQRPEKMVNRIAPRRGEVGKINLAPRGLLILAEFTDCKFLPENTHEDFDSLSNARNYDYNGAIGSARQYFFDQSDGQYEPQFDVVGPVQLPNTFAYYGENNGIYDRYTGDFVMDAVAAANETVDFSIYDNDGNGVIDFVYIIYAGKGEADGGGANTIWPHNWDLMSNFYYGYTNQSTYYYKSPQDYLLPRYDGIELNDYACSQELLRSGARTGIGVICHEFSHVLGLPDYYTSNLATMPLSYTPGSWSLMGYGCYLGDSNTPCNYSAYDKYYFNWVTPEVLDSNRQITLPADGKTYAMVTRDCREPKAGAMTPDTVYYLENRQYTGWDINLPGHGLLVWRVIYDAAEWLNNTPNDNVARYFLMTADGSLPYTTDKYGGQKENMPFPGTEHITELQLFNYTIKDIQEQSNGDITFTFVYLDGHTDLYDTDIPTAVSKQIINGKLVIIRNGKRYDITGRAIQ